MTAERNTMNEETDRKVAHWAVIAIFVIFSMLLIFGRAW